MTRRPPFVLGEARANDGSVYELSLRRDGSVRAWCLRTGAVVDGLSLHEIGEALRAHAEASA